jgi:hypothetical protein
MNKSSTPIKILLTVAAIFYLVFISRTSFDVNGQRFFTLIDDAMISMRYARNLAQGHGLVWNIGQPPVEGFTNPGWTLVMAALHLLPFSPAHISLTVMILAAVLLLMNILVVFHIVQTIDASARLAPLIAAMMTAFYFPLVFWTLRGLEVGALSLAINIALYLTLRLTRDPKPATVSWLALSLGVALLIRMDAFMQVALLLLFLFASLREMGNMRPVYTPIIVAFLTLIAILIFQRLYFGDFLPNTYYLKVNGVTAWERIRAGLLSLNDYASRDFLMPLVISLIGLATIKDLRSRLALLLLGLFLVQVAYSVWVGGDYAEELVDSANRFIAQGMPALFILFSLVLERFLKTDPATQFKPILACAIGLGALLVISAEPWNKWLISNAPMLRTDVQRVKLGLHILAHTDPQAVVAVHAAGQIPYFSQRTTIDLLGKNDPVIAKGPPATSFAAGHNKWNYEYSILQLKPDVIADNFNRFADYIGGVPEYQRLPNGIFVRSDSTLVDVTGLSADY